PTKRNTKKENGTKGQGGKNLKDKKKRFNGDPPILVGGGGSTLVWIHKDVFDQELTGDEIDDYIQAYPTAPLPMATVAQSEDNYYCFLCDVDIARIESDAGHILGGGHNQKIQHPPAGKFFDAAKHKTIFKAT
ncbi:MAG: hypothetical protein M3362_20025, partial [Acidobacteriota bacterium]|nr:hypothetical protein [Acidobacteriota bacterium]